jgi:hypothetical protein
MESGESSAHSTSHLPGPHARNTRLVPGPVGGSVVNLVVVILLLFAVILGWLVLLGVLDYLNGR